MAPRPLRRLAGQNMSEAGASVVSVLSSDGGSGNAEPMNGGRRQHRGRKSGDGTLGFPGVRGLAREEGCLEEDGRPSEVLADDESVRVSRGISVTREIPREASRGVGGDRSTWEAPVMGEEGRVSALTESSGKVWGEPTGREAYKRQEVSRPDRRDTEGTKARGWAMKAGSRANDVPEGRPAPVRAFRHWIAGCGKSARPVRRGGDGERARLNVTPRVIALLYDGGALVRQCPTLPYWRNHVNSGAKRQATWEQVTGGWNALFDPGSFGHPIGVRPDKIAHSIAQ